MWGRSARNRYAQWSLRHRLFDTPAITADDAPWVTYLQNKTGAYHNGFGQRVEGSCLHNGSLYLITSAKNHEDARAVSSLIPATSVAECECHAPADWLQAPRWD